MQKRVIAQRLIEITLRTFHLRSDQRYQTSIQFITRFQAVNGPKPALTRGADFTLEVMGHNLTEEKKRAFAEEAVAMLTPFVPVKLRGRIARRLGIKTDATRQIALQFNELSLAISDPFFVDPQRRAP
jgi:hypothetical protein